MKCPQCISIMPDIDPRWITEQKNHSMCSLMSCVCTHAESIHLFMSVCTCLFDAPTVKAFMSSCRLVLVCMMS